MSVTTPVCKGKPVSADKLTLHAAYNVATNDGLMHATYEGKCSLGLLVFFPVGEHPREKHVHPSSLFFDPALDAEGDIKFAPDDTPEEPEHEDGPED